MGHLARMQTQITKLFHTVDCFWDVVYPYGNDTQDQEMEVDLVKNKDCLRVDYKDGFYFFDEKRYFLFVSLSYVLMNSNLCGLKQN